MEFFFFHRGCNRVAIFIVEFLHWCFFLHVAVPLTEEPLQGVTLLHPNMNSWDGDHSPASPSAAGALIKSNGWMDKWVDERMGGWMDV